MSLTRRRWAAAVVALLFVPWWAAPTDVAAAPTPDVEGATPRELAFPTGGGSAYTNLSLERYTHVRNATLVLEGGTVLRETAHHLNTTSVLAGTANGWRGALDAPAPTGPVETYLAVPLNATQVAGAAALDDVYASALSVPGNRSFETFVIQVGTLDLIQLNFTWAGFAFGGAGPAYSAELFLFNFTDQEWEQAASYPSAQSGVQRLAWNRTSPWNYLAPTGSLALMAVSGTANATMNTDFVEVVAVAGVYPRPAVDVGNDGGIDWRFDAPGWGSIGRQMDFENGSAGADVTFPEGGGNFSTAFLMPRNALPSSATMRVLALPAANSTNASGANRTVAGNGTAGLAVSGLANNSVGTTGFVTLRNVTTLNATTVENQGAPGGELISGSDPNGYRRAGQSFNATGGSPLSSLSFFVSQFQGSPGPLVLTVETLNLTGMPSGSVLATQTIPEGQLGSNRWITFEGLNYTPPFDQNLVAVLSLPSAPPDTASNYLTFGATLSDAFPQGDGFSYINLTGVGETWVKPADTDLLFRLGQDVPSTSSDAQDVLVDGTPGTYSQFGNVSSIAFVLPAPLLANGSHSFSISNANPESLRFNWTLRLDYSRLAERLDLTVPGSSLHLVENNLSTGIEVDLWSTLVEILQPVVCVPSCFYRTLEFVPIPIRLTSSTQGRVLLADLDVRYDVLLPASDLAPALDAYLWTTPNDAPRADVPIRVYSPGPSTLTLSLAYITYDRPPVFYGFNENVSVEDVPLVFDLNTLFHDDWDNANLSYSFTTPGGTANASVALVGGYNLSITPLPNASGSVVVNVTATDRSGLRNSSGEVVFNFTPVDDPPRLTVFELNVTWGSVVEVDLTPLIEDPDDPISSATIIGTSGARVSFSGRSLIFDLDIGAGDFPLNLTLTDGVATANSTVLVHPRASDTEPALLEVPPLEFSWASAYRVDLGLYASDLEDNLSELSFMFNVSSGAPADLLWTTETNATSTYLKLIPRALAGGNYTAVLTVTDRDGHTNSTTVSVRVTAPANRPPSIVGLPPSLALGGEPLTLPLATHWSDAEDQQPGVVTWSATSGSPSLFTVTYDPSSQVVTLEPVAGASGVGSLTLTLRDSGGLSDSMTISVSVEAPATAPLTTGEASLMLALVFAAVVLLAAFAVRRDRSRGGGGARAPPGRSPPALGSLAAQTPVADDGDGPDEGSPRQVGEFLRGHEDSPGASAEPPGAGTGAAPVAAPAAAAAASALAGAGAGSPEADTPRAAATARVGELYVIGLKDGSLIFQEPAKNLPELSQADENRLLQWAFDSVREELDRAGDASLLDWEGQPVVVARGESFFVVGRVEGADPESVVASVKPLIVEVDHEFPGSPHDWQRADLLDTVTDILRRLVR